MHEQPVAERLSGEALLKVLGQVVGVVVVGVAGCGRLLRFKDVFAPGIAVLEGNHAPDFFAQGGGDGLFHLV
ncbi:hypothetical protein D3C79_846880 [compost metagenome]